MSAFPDWLASTAASDLIKNSPWIIPVVQTIHILTISLLVGVLIMFCMRLTGAVASPISPQQAKVRLFRWGTGALTILLLSGSILIVGEPQREFGNIFFWIKMCLILVGVLATIWMHAPARQNETNARGNAGVIYSTFLVAIVCAIMFAGRWIAYSGMPDGT